MVASTVIETKRRIADENEYGAINNFIFTVLVIQILIFEISYYIGDIVCNSDNTVRKIVKPIYITACKFS